MSEYTGARVTMAEPINDQMQRYEWEFVASALTGCFYGTVDARTIAAIVPWQLLEVPECRTLWRSAIELSEKGVRPNYSSIHEYARAQREKHKIKTDEWLLNLDSDQVRSLMLHIDGRREDAILHNARRMRTEGLKRRAVKPILDCLAMSQTFGIETDELMKGLQDAMETLKNDFAAGRSYGELMDVVIEQIKNPSAARPMPTPWDNLNAVLKGGFANGELVVLAGRPGMGKTAFAACVALDAAKRGVNTLFISREVKDVTLCQRLMAREARVKASCFREYLDNANLVLGPLMKVRYEQGLLPLTIVEKSTLPMTPLEVRRIARGMKNVGLIVIDYLQLLNADVSRAQNREREVADMSRTMKQLALDCDCPVLLLSQMNRRVEDGNREPMLSDLRESGAIEQDADIVIFLHADREDINLDDMPVRACVAKGRSSGTGCAGLIFRKQYADFDIDPLPLSERQPKRKPRNNEFL